MKLVEIKCKNCGSLLNENSDSSSLKCKYCGTVFKLDDEIVHHQFDNAEQMGYEFEKGKIKAREEANQEKINQKNAAIKAQLEKEKKQKNLKWWIIGWIFFFPIPLTIVIWKSRLDKKKKIIITILLWIVLLFMGYTS